MREPDARHAVQMIQVVHRQVHTPTRQGHAIDQTLVILSQVKGQWCEAQPVDHQIADIGRGVGIDQQRAA